MPKASLSTHALVNRRNAMKVDAALPLELLGPLGCGNQTGAGAALNFCKVRAGSSVAVIGSGAVGTRDHGGATAARDSPPV